MSGPIFRLKRWGGLMLSTRKAVAGDREAILGLIGKVFGEEVAGRAEGLWGWQWEQDPRLETPGYQGVIVEWDGQMIATMAMIPAGLWLRGQPVEAFWYADALVHFAGVRRALRAARSSGDPDQLALFSQGLSQIIFTAPELTAYQLGKHLTPPMQIAARAAGAIEQAGTQSFGRVVSLKGLLKKPLGRFLGPVLGAFLDLFLPAIPKPKRKVVRLDGLFDARFDALWQRVIPQHTAITRRDAAVLNWRYRAHPEKSYEVWMVEGEAEVLGYLVLGRLERHGQPRAQVVDLLALDEEAEVLRALLSRALRGLRREGVLKVECYTGSAAVKSVLERLRFKERMQEGRSMPVVIRPDPGIDSLYVTRGDGDGG